MPWFLRRSFKLGPLRINLSKSGLGLSAGIRGLRVGLDAKGRRYLAGGRGGIYFREYVKPGATLQEPAGVAPSPVETRSRGWAWFWFIVAMLAVLAAVVEVAR